MAKQTSPSWLDFIQAINALREESNKNMDGLRADIRAHNEELKIWINELRASADKKHEEMTALSDEKDKTLSMRINVVWAGAGVILLGMAALFFAVIQTRVIP